MLQKRKVVLTLILAVIFAAFLLKNAIPRGDFVVFLQASEKLFNDENIYAPPFINGLQYFYSPFFALLLYPLTVNYVFGCFVWLLLSSFFLYRIIQLSKAYFSFSKFSKQDLILLSIAVGILNIRFLLYNFGMVQMTIFLLWAILESLRLHQSKKYILAGLLLALAINIKVLPIVIVPYLLYRRYFKTLTYTGIFSIALLCVPAIFIGWDANLALHSNWWNAINPESTAFIKDDMDRGPHGLNALVISLFMDTPDGLPYSRNLFNLDLPQVKIILYSIIFLLAGFTLFFLRTMPFTSKISNFHKYWELSYICLLIPLIFPHQQKYAFFFIFPVTFYIVYFKIFQMKHNIFSKSGMITGIVFLFISFILSTLSTDGLIGRDLNNITQYFKFVTYGTLILIIPLAIFKPKYLENG